MKAKRRARKRLTIRVDVLSDEEKAVACEVMNRDGAAGPSAHAGNLHLFFQAYLFDCLDKWGDRLTDAARTTASSLREKLERADDCAIYDQWLEERLPELEPEGSEREGVA